MLDGKLSMTLDDFKREYPDLTRVLTEEGRAQERTATGKAAAVIAAPAFTLAQETQSPAAPRHAGETIEQAAQREWNNDPTLRAEFVGDFKTYAAFRRAESRGAVRAL